MKIKKRNLMTLLALGVGSSIFLNGKAFADEVSIPDVNLKTAIIRELKKENVEVKDNKISDEDLLKVKKIVAPSSHIRSLKGLDKAKNLEIVELAENEISDASELKNLKNLKGINLGRQVIEVKKDGNPINYKIFYLDGKVLEPSTVSNGTYKNGKIEIKDNSKPVTVNFLSGEFSGVVKYINSETPKQKVVDEKNMIDIKTRENETIEESTKSDLNMKENAKEEIKKRDEKKKIVENKKEGISPLLLGGGIIGIGVIVLATLVFKNKK